MKKTKCRIIIFVCLLVGGLVFSNNVFAETVYIWGQKNPVAYEPLSWLDHTYACVGNYSNCYTCPAYASISGGVPVDGGYADAENAECFAFCRLDYGENGVCHQHANRVLYQTGRTLNTSVRGYSLSRWYYGITGDVGPTFGQFWRCLEHCMY